MTTVLDTIDEELSLVLRPIAKSAPRLPRSEQNEPARLRFVAALDALGWSWDRVATLLGCSKTSVIAVYKGHRYVSAWMLDRLDTVPEIRALPTRERVAQLRRAG